MLAFCHFQIIELKRKQIYSSSKAEFLVLGHLALLFLGLRETGEHGLGHTVERSRSLVQVGSKMSE